MAAARSRRDRDVEAAGETGIYDAVIIPAHAVSRPREAQPHVLAVVFELVPKAQLVAVAPQKRRPLVNTGWGQCCVRRLDFRATNPLGVP